MQLSGVHHLTAVSADAPGNVKFYTQLLGLRMVKKTVNQDDTSAYHLFYADGLASPGSDITFFDFPAAPEKRGNNTITRTGFRVAGQAALQWWHERLKKAAVKINDTLFFRLATIHNLRFMTLLTERLRENRDGQGE